MDYPSYITHDTQMLIELTFLPHIWPVFKTQRFNRKIDVRRLFVKRLVRGMEDIDNVNPCMHTILEQISAADSYDEKAKIIDAYYVRSLN